MPRPMLKTPQKTETQAENKLSATKQQDLRQQGNCQQAQQISKIKLDRLLRQPRSKEYMEALHKLDAGGHVHNQDQVNKIIDDIKKEFPEVEIEGILLGIVSVCYLGKPYEVHTLDITGEIIEHYKAGHTMPGGLERARGIALHGGYEFVEVYIDCCRAVNSNGAVSVIPG